MSAASEFLKTNQHYTENFTKGDKPMPPAKKVAIVACMDARIETGRLLGLEEGDAHVIRNAGGVITDDVIRSLAISQQLLGTTEIVLIHHTDCGMLTFKDDELKARIEKDTGLRPPFALEAFQDVEDDVRQSIRRIRSNPFVTHKDNIHGFIYDVATGRLNEVAEREYASAAGR